MVSSDRRTVPLNGGRGWGEEGGKERGRDREGDVVEKGGLLCALCLGEVCGLSVI